MQCKDCDRIFRVFEVERHVLLDCKLKYALLPTTGRVRIAPYVLPWNDVFDNPEWHISTRTGDPDWLAVNM